MKTSIFLLKSCTCLAAFSLFSISALADDYAYVAGVGTVNQIYSVDLTTGATTYIGPGGPYGLAGLGQSGSGIYGLTDIYNGDMQLVNVNTTTGIWSYVGGFDSSGTTMAGAAMGSTPTGLYTLGYDNNLYSMNPTTGVATLIGATGLSSVGSWFGLSTGSSNLYIAYQDPTSTFDLLGQVNTSTGAVTVLGQINIDNPTIDALAYVNGTWYTGAGAGPYEVESLNISTLTATQVSQAPATGGFYGMVPEAVPEPKSILLTGLGAFGIFFRLAKRRS